MDSSFLSAVFVAVLGLLCRPETVDAQIYESVGTRAQGMAGAFVAVADDATATWWNPAGIAVTYFSIVIERGEMNVPVDVPPSGPGWRAKTGSFAATFPALGLSYYRLRVSEIAPGIPTGEAGGVRQDTGAAGTGLGSLVTHQFGATIGQSIGKHLVIASTLRLVRAGHRSVATASGTLDMADELDVPLETHGDLDLGALATIGSARVGVSVKHLREPEFAAGDVSFALKRQARAGFAWVAGKPGSVAIATAAFDVDLTRTPTVLGDARHVAGGVELSFPRHQLAFRGGANANTVGDVSRSMSAGASIAVLRGVYLDGAATFGSDLSRKGWAVGFRLTI